MAGCSAGSLVAACAMSGCCLGQMCSDALEIAVRARSRALGPLHPTFSIVDIIRNGLRRILPPNAHEICSGRLYISLTRWKDNKNVVISQFHSREELIQVLICSSFVPYWSGIIPHKFRGEVAAALSSNFRHRELILVLLGWRTDQQQPDHRRRHDSSLTIRRRKRYLPARRVRLVLQCGFPRSGSTPLPFAIIDDLFLTGTDISCTQENLYRMTRALFPPNISVLKQICWRGYIDGLKFLQTRSE